MYSPHAGQSFRNFTSSCSRATRPVCSGGFCCSSAIHFFTSLRGILRFPAIASAVLPARCASRVISLFMYVQTGSGRIRLPPRPRSLAPRPRRPHQTQIPRLDPAMDHGKRPGPNGETPRISQKNGVKKMKSKRQLRSSYFCPHLFDCRPSSVASSQ